MTTVIIEIDAYFHVGEKKVSVEDEFDEGSDNESAKKDTSKVFLSDQ